MVEAAAAAADTASQTARAERAAPVSPATSEEAGPGLVIVMELSDSMGVHLLAAEWMVARRSVSGASRMLSVDRMESKRK